MIIDCISDLHGYFPELPGGDLLLMAGDYTATHKCKEWDAFYKWMEALPYRKVVFIAGNHDDFLACLPETDKERKIVSEIDHVLGISGENFSYLCDSGLEFEGFKIWGSPWIKSFVGMNPRAKNFTLDSEEELEKKWALIPTDTDILLTHSPIFGKLDCIPKTFRKKNVPYPFGSLSLKQRLYNLPNLKLHVFGHIHECGGDQDRCYLHDNIPILVNAAVMDENYVPRHAKPYVTIELK